MKLVTRDNDAAIARHVGVSPSTISRWRSGEVDPKPRQVVSFATSYGRSPLSALVAADYLSAEDLEGDLPLGNTHDLDEVSTYALLDELQRRMEAMGDYIGWLSSIGTGTGSPANLSADSLRGADPAVPPADADGMVLINAIADHLKVTSIFDGSNVYGLKNEYVSGPLPLHLKEHFQALIESKRAEAEAKGVGHYSLRQSGASQNVVPLREDEVPAEADDPESAWSTTEDVPEFDAERMAAKRGRRKADEIGHAE